MQLFQATNCSVVRFLDLPGEIRNRIYHFVYADAEGQVILWINQKSTSTTRIRIRERRQTATSNHYLALPSVCRQIRSEASPYLNSVVRVGIDTGCWSGKKSVANLFKDVLFHNYFTRSLEAFVSDHGPNLHHVEHMYVVGHMIAMPFLDPMPGDPLYRAWRAFRTVESRFFGRCLRAAHSSRDHLANVTCVTLATSKEVLADVTWSNIALKNSPCGVAWIPGVEDRRLLHRVFPKSREVRSCSNTTCWRFRVGSDGDWTYWYTGEHMR